VRAQLSILHVMRRWMGRHCGVGKRVERKRRLESWLLATSLAIRSRTPARRTVRGSSWVRFSREVTLAALADHLAVSNHSQGVRESPESRERDGIVWFVV
jgi:hypothetical protein